MRIPFLLSRGCRLLHQVARNGDFAKEAAHYHNTDRAFELPLLSGNFKGMEMKFMRVEFLSPPAWAALRLFDEVSERNSHVYNM